MHTDCRLFRGEDAARTWVLAAPRAAVGRRRRLEARGVRVLSTPRRRGHLNLARALARLVEEGLTSLFVEGGGGLAADSINESTALTDTNKTVLARVLGDDVPQWVGGYAYYHDPLRGI